LALSLIRAVPLPAAFSQHRFDFDELFQLFFGEIDVSLTDLSARLRL
jgi:hypothetical protein